MVCDVGLVELGQILGGRLGVKPDEPAALAEEETPSTWSIKKPVTKTKVE
jgi:hypothetical protein